MCTLYQTGVVTNHVLAQALEDKEIVVLWVFSALGRVSDRLF